MWYINKILQTILIYYVILLFWCIFSDSGICFPHSNHGEPKNTHKQTHYMAQQECVVRDSGFLAWNNQSFPQYYSVPQNCREHSPFCGAHLGRFSSFSAISSRRCQTKFWAADRCPKVRWSLFFTSPEEQHRRWGILHIFWLVVGPPLWKILFNWDD